MPNILRRHALPRERLVGLGDTREFFHGLLGRLDLQHTKLDEKPGKVIDLPFAHNLVVL